MSSPSSANTFDYSDEVWPHSARWFLALGAISACTSVVFSAAFAHLPVFAGGVPTAVQTALSQQQFHSLGLLFTGLALRVCGASRWLQAAGWLMGVGLFLFRLVAHQCMLLWRLVCFARVSLCFRRRYGFLIWSLEFFKVRRSLSECCSGLIFCSGSWHVSEQFLAAQRYSPCMHTEFHGLFRFGVRPARASEIMFASPLLLQVHFSEELPHRTGLGGAPHTLVV